MKDEQRRGDCEGVLNRRPYMLVGAGPLTATIWKSGTDRTDWNYRFNIVRTNQRTGAVSQQFLPGDLRHLAKLVQVVAFTLADDGCISDGVRRELKSLSQLIRRILDLNCSEHFEGIEP